MSAATTHCQSPLIRTIGTISLMPIITPGSFLRRLFTPKKYLIEHPLTIQIGRAFDIYIPAGTLTDGASVPRFLKPLFPDDALFSWAAFAHDRLYQSGDQSKPIADAVFYTLLRRVDKLPWFTSAVMFLGVVIGGGPAWRAHRAHDPSHPSHPSCPSHPSHSHN